jgi:hypothetical protein
MGRLRANAYVIMHAFEMQIRQNFMDAFVLFGILVQPLIIAMLAFWMLQERGGDYVIFVVVGSGMTGLWTSVLFISGNSITQERWTGTLELLIGAPTKIQVVVFGKNLPGCGLWQEFSQCPPIAGFDGVEFFPGDPDIWICALCGACGFVYYFIDIGDRLICLLWIGYFPLVCVEPGCTALAKWTRIPCIHLERVLIPYCSFTRLDNAVQLHPGAVLGRPRPACILQRWQLLDRHCSLLGHDDFVQCGVYPAF